MIQKFTAFLLITFLINACCGSKASSELKETPNSYRKIAESKLGDNYRISFNSDSTYLIAYHSEKSTPQNVNPPLKFFIYSLNDNKIVFEENLPNGKIEWINDRQVKVSIIPGIVSEVKGKNKRAFGYIYDIKLKKKIYGDEESKTLKQ
jgi:hypothetical protein